MSVSKRRDLDRKKLQKIIVSSPIMALNYKTRSLGYLG